MDAAKIMNELKTRLKIEPVSVTAPRADEMYIEVAPADFKAACHRLHKILHSPVMLLFALDERPAKGSYAIHCLFLALEYRRWIFICTNIAGEKPAFDSIAKEVYSANLFEREIKEMFGIEPKGNPDDRRLRLHDEVWPEGFYPLRKDFDPRLASGEIGEYRFAKVEGEGIFEVPVGPVHAGIIGPGHFRFSVAGEPIIHLDIRLGFSHRGVEKLFEGKRPDEAVKLSECVAGDSSFAHSGSFCRAVEKIAGVSVPERALYLRVIFLELERMYNHMAGISGIALDVGFSFAAAYASMVKEAIHALNEALTGSRYLKVVNVVGGVLKDIDEQKKVRLVSAIDKIMKDLREIKAILNANGSFLDRVDGTGVLAKNIAEDLGIVGLAGRASGIALDLRKNAPVYATAGFNLVTRKEGDVMARLNVRLDEFEESARLVRELVRKLPAGELIAENHPVEGSGLGYVEGWRGPVLYWLKLGQDGRIERCKVVDPSFHNWPGLSSAVLENIIPDFPVCNKSFDLSYAGNDL